MFTSAAADLQDMLLEENQDDEAQAVLPNLALKVWLIVENSEPFTKMIKDSVSGRLKTKSTKIPFVCFVTWARPACKVPHKIAGCIDIIKSTGVLRDDILQATIESEHHGDAWQEEA